MRSSRQHSSINSNSITVVDLLTTAVVTFFFVDSTNKNEHDSGTDCCFLSSLPEEEECRNKLIEESERSLIKN